MKLKLFVCAFLAAIGVVNGEPGAAVRNATNEDIRALTDRLLFHTSLPKFIDRRDRRKENDSLNWTTDGCTHGPDNPFRFPFLPACIRHDFGYNNYRAQDRFTKINKRDIDDQFKLEYERPCS